MSMEYSNSVKQRQNESDFAQRRVPAAQLCKWHCVKHAREMGAPNFLRFTRTRHLGRAVHFPSRAEQHNAKGEHEEKKIRPTH